MQFKTLIAALALAMTSTTVIAMPAAEAEANPAPNPSTAPPAKTSSAPAPVKTCSSSQTVSCCNAKYSLINLQCISLSLLSLLGQQCDQSSSIACCPNSGVQNGLVNIGTVCVPISANL